jgi:hypothetical protein
VSLDVRLVVGRHLTAGSLTAGSLTAWALAAWPVTLDLGLLWALLLVGHSELLLVDADRAILLHKTA